MLPNRVQRGVDAPNVVFDSKPLLDDDSQHRMYTVKTSQIPPSCVCEQFIYSQDRYRYFPAVEYRQTYLGNINSAQTHCAAKAIFYYLYGLL